MPPWSITSKLHAVCQQSWVQIDKIEKFPRRGYRRNWKIVNFLHQLAALQGSPVGSIARFTQIDGILKFPKIIP